MAVPQVAEDAPLIPSMPGAEVMRRAWVVLSDERVAYIDHYKADGKFGVRPVDSDGRHYANTSEHWSEAQRCAVPEEFALSVNQFRGANMMEIPARWRHGVTQ